MPTSVMPICTVERKRPGSSASARAALAPWRPGVGHGLEPGLSGGDDGELGQGEQPVEGNQDQSDDKFEQILVWLTRGREQPPQMQAGR